MQLSLSLTGSVCLRLSFRQSKQELFPAAIVGGGLVVVVVGGLNLQGLTSKCFQGFQVHSCALSINKMAS